MRKAMPSDSSSCDSEVGEYLRFKFIRLSTSSECDFNPTRRDKLRLLLSSRLGVW